MAWEYLMKGYQAWVIYLCYNYQIFTDLGWGMVAGLAIQPNHKLESTA
jgi:hypothetical protein